MGRRKLVWNEEGKLSTDKTLEKTPEPSVIAKTSTTEIGSEIEAEPTGKSHKVFKENTTQQSVSAGDKKKLPKITLSYHDRDGKLVIYEYICAHIRIDQDQSTILEGLPTGRKDTVHISIDAQVVKID